MGGPAFGLLCLLLLAAVVVVPLFTADLAKAALAAYRQQQQQQQGGGYGAPGAFEARRVTIKELSLRASPPDIVDGGGATAAGGCVLVADLLQSSEIGWAIALHSPDDAPPPQEGHHSNPSCPSYYYTSRRCAGTPMGALMDAAMRALTLATRGGDRSWAPPPPPPPGWRSETSAAQGWTRLSSGGGDGTDPVGGHVELLLTHPAPHRPIRARLQDGTHVRELFFIPDLVGDLSAPDQERLAAAVAGAAWQTDADGTEAAVQGATDLCQWAHCRVHLDDDHDYDDNEGGLTSQPESGVQRAVPRSKRQTEVIVINRRKKHHGGHGAAVAIGLGVGLGVGIPVVVLLALIPFVIALWLIRKRRRGSRTIRVADVPTGVFAAGQPAENPAYREEEPEYQGSVSPIGSDLQSALGENY